MTRSLPGSSPAELSVDVDIDGETINAAHASFTTRNGRLTTTLTYERSYLASSQAYAIDPNLPLDLATHTVDGLPSALADTAPDWWGRNLISRRVRSEAAAGGRPMPIVSEVDYVLGVSDVTRQGALRLRAPSASRSFWRQTRKCRSWSTWETCSRHRRQLSLRMTTILVPRKL